MVKVNRKEAEPMKEGYVDNRFASLYYKEMGQGMPLIMLHGNGEMCIRDSFYVYNMESRGRKPLRILDKKGFIKVQRTDGEVVLAKASSYRSIVSRMWEEMAIFKADAILRPDYYLCVGCLLYTSRCV